MESHGVDFFFSGRVMYPSFEAFCSVSPRKTVPTARMGLGTAVVVRVAAAFDAFDRFQIKPILGSACMKRHLIGSYASKSAEVAQISHQKLYQSKRAIEALVEAARDPVGLEITTPHCFR